MRTLKDENNVVVGFVGETGMRAKLTETLKNEITSGSGIAYVDGKGDCTPMQDMLKRAKECGRSDELFLIDFSKQNKE